MINNILLQAGEGGFNPNMMIMMGGILVVFYFFMIRPQQKKQKDQKKFKESLKKGDEVMTIGGLWGKIASVEDDQIILDVDRGTKLKFQASSIAMPEAKKKK